MPIRVCVANILRVQGWLYAGGKACDKLDEFPSPKAVSASEPEGQSPAVPSVSGKSVSAEPAGTAHDTVSSAGTSKSSYWDEEDELEQDLKRAMRKQTEPDGSGATKCCTP